MNRIGFVRPVCSLRNGLTHEVTRSEVYSEVPSLLLEDSVLNEFPLRVRFRGEMGYDTGGVCRDMFSCFWEEIFKKLFDGSGLLVPVVHPHIDVSSDWHGPLTWVFGDSLVCGILPTRITFQHWLMFF